MATTGDFRARFAAALNEAKADTLEVQLGGEVLGKILKTDVKTQAEIKSAVNGAAFEADIKSFLVDVVQIPGDDNVETGFQILRQSTNPEQMLGYLNNRTLKPSDFTKVSDPISITQDFLALPANAAQKLYTWSWKSTPSTGRGEVWLSLMLKDGRRPNTGEKGDTIIDKKEWEVKGDGARIAGQKGFGDAKQMPSHLNTAIVNFCSRVGRMAPEFLNDSAKDNAWNIGKKSGGLLGQALEALAKEKKFDKKDLAALNVELLIAYKKYLLGSDSTLNLTDAIASNGKINLAKYNRILLEMYYDHYAKTEKFAGIVLVSYTKANKFLVCTKPEDFLTAFDAGQVKIAATPSFTKAAGAQGGSFAIQLV